MRANSGYDVFLICENGHAVNSLARSAPQYNAKHCGNCGAITIDACPSCQSFIRGTYLAGMRKVIKRKAPAYCHECGLAYPWTKSALESAEELIRFNESLSGEEKDDLVAAVKETIKDTPTAKVAAEKIRVYGRKVGEAAYKIILEVVSDVASETTKKTLGLK